MPDETLSAADAALTTALAAVKAAEAGAPAATNIEAIIANVRAETIPGSPISQDAAALGHLDFVFIPALIAALTKGV
jgi:hypothetical protein